jgi:hypothetical protein
MSNLSYQRIYRSARDNFFMQPLAFGRMARGQTEFLSCATLVGHLDHGSSPEGRGPFDCRDQRWLTVPHASRLVPKTQRINVTTIITPGHLPIATVTGLEIYKKTLNTTVLTNKSCLLSPFQVL